MYLSENIKPSTFSSRVFARAAAGRLHPGQPRGGMGMAGGGRGDTGTGYPRCPGRCQGPNPPQKIPFPPVGFNGGESRGAGAGAAGPREAGWGRGGRGGAGGAGVGGSAGNPPAQHPRRRAARMAPTRPRKVEAWPTGGGPRAADPKGADFVLLNFLGKIALLAAQRRTGRLGASVIFHLPLLSDLTCSPGWVSSPPPPPPAPPQTSASPGPGMGRGGPGSGGRSGGFHGSFRGLGVCSVSPSGRVLTGATIAAGSAELCLARGAYARVSTLRVRRRLG